MSDTYNLEEFDKIERIEHPDHSDGQYRLVTLGDKKGVFSITTGIMVVPLTQCAVQILPTPSIQKTDYIIWLVTRNSDDNFNYLYACSKHTAVQSLIKSWDNRNHKLYNIVNPNVIIQKTVRSTEETLIVTVLKGHPQKDTSIIVGSQKIHGIKEMQNNRFMIVLSGNFLTKLAIYIFKEDGSFEERVDMVS